MLRELTAPSSSAAAIRGLLGLAPTIARRLREDGSDEDNPFSHVHVGDRLRVRPSQKVPVDGEVLEGRSSVEASILTGVGIAMGTDIATSSAQVTLDKGDLNAILRARRISETGSTT